MIDVQAEADRLLALDEPGRNRELLVVALRLGQQADANWAALREMDRDYLDAITDYRGRDSVAPAGA